MLTYPPAAFMQTRHPASVHFAAAAVPGSVSSYGHQALPAFPQFCSATSPPLPPTVAAFAALQAQIPSPIRLSPPAAAHRLEAATEQVLAAESKKKSESVQQQGGGSKCSFSIESILSRDDDKSAKNNRTESRSSRDQQAPTGSSLSPATPLSAGQKPNGFYYFYPSPTAQPFPLTPQSCLDSELHRSAALHGRLSAPVAVISEIVRNAAGK